MNENALKKELEVSTMFQPQKGQFIALALSENGAGSFTYLKEAQSEQREIYFVDDIATGAISEATMLLGQFIFEFEGAPSSALPMTPGGTNRIYFPHDKRVSLYDSLTSEEKESTKRRMVLLAEKCPQYAEKIRELISKL